MATPESKASDVVRVSASQTMGSRLFRNNMGVLKDERGVPVFFGLGNEPKHVEGKRMNQQIKFGDFIGYTPIIVTPEMVGQKIAVFTNVEVKPDGKLQSTIRKAEKHPTSREGLQLKAIKLVKDAGGIAGFATNATDIKNIWAEFWSQFWRK